VSGPLNAFAGLLALGVGGLLAAYGTGAEGARHVIRWTARSSFCLLCWPWPGKA
jgi:hypothetical protein